MENPTAVCSKDKHALEHQKKSNLLVLCPNVKQYGAPYCVDVSEVITTNGTLELAVKASYVLGARKMHFYGIDSYFGEGGYSFKMKQVHPGFPLAPASMRSYEEILENTKRIITKNNIEAVFHNDD